MKLMVFHGTRKASSILLDGFHPSSSGEFGPGIYFTERPETAVFYAEHVARGDEPPTVLAATIELQNPYVVKKVDWIRQTERRSPRTVQNALKHKGHDGIVGIAINDYERQIVIFNRDSVIGPISVYASYE